MKEISDVLPSLTPKQRETMQDMLEFGRASQRWAVEAARQYVKTNNAASRARRGFKKRLICGPRP